MNSERFFKSTGLEAFLANFNIPPRIEKCRHTISPIAQYYDDYSEDDDYDFDQCYCIDCVTDDGKTCIRPSKFCSSCVEEADQMARQLIEEEKKEKLEAKTDLLKKEKKRLKKQRQKEKKRVEQQKNGDPIKTEENEDIDLNSAFIARAVEKLAISKKVGTDKLKNTSSSNANSKTSGKHHPVTPLALEAFSCATDGEFQSAIEKYTEALKVSPEDFRLYVNRSLCYLQIREYNNALEDALLCITYAPDYAKGYFRKGEAYLGLDKLDFAEESFETVLKLDPDCQEAANDLIFVRVKKIMDMGYSKNQASFAMRNAKSVAEAVQFLLDHPEYGEKDTGASAAEIFYSDVDENSESDTFDPSDASSMISSVALSSHASVWDFNIKDDPYTDVLNPYKCCDLYVGNIANEVQQHIVKSYFERYGTLTSIKMMRSSRSALISYDDWQAASNAMKNLQKSMFLPQTPKIEIRYPVDRIAPFLNWDKKTNASSSNLVKMKDRNFCSQTLHPASPSPSLSSTKSTRSDYRRQPAINPTQDPSNPTNCVSLYVGNVTSKLKEKHLLESFSRYGRVTSLRIIESSNCAFINFDSGRSAGNAMRNLQNKSLRPGTPNITIKYPSKALNSGSRKDHPADKPLACYRWRTAGFCEFGKRCSMPHIPDQKGIAMSHKAVVTKRN